MKNSFKIFILADEFSHPLKKDMAESAYESLNFHNENVTYLDFHLDFFFSTCLLPHSKRHRLVNANERIRFTTVWHYSGGQLYT